MLLGKSFTSPLEFGTTWNVLTAGLWTISGALVGPNLHFIIDFKPGTVGDIQEVQNVYYVLPNQHALPWVPTSEIQVLDFSFGAILEPPDLTIDFGRTS